MNNKNDSKELYEKEKEYADIFEAFLNSEDEKKFSKNEVEQIIEAHFFKEVIDNYHYDEKAKKDKNLLISTKEFGARIFNFKTILSFLLTYIFYTGLLILINAFIYPNLLHDRNTLIIAIALSLADKLIKPFLFIADLITFTIHKIGLVTLAIFTVLIYFTAYFLGDIISLERALIISIIVLAGITIVDFLKRDSFFKTKYIDEFDLEVGSEEDGKN
jgi:hypothetical protein